MNTVSKWSLVSAGCVTLVALQLYARPVEPSEMFWVSTLQPATQPTTQPVGTKAIAAGEQGSRGHEHAPDAPLARDEKSPGTIRTDNVTARSRGTEHDAKADRNGSRSREVWEAREARDRAGGFMLGRSPGDRYENDEQPDADEWDEIVEFMKENTPIRYEICQSILGARGADDRISLSIRRRIAGRYRDLQSIKGRQSDMYGFALKQTIIEDQVLGTMRDLRKLPDDAAESKQLNEQLHGQVKDYVSNFLDEREARLQKLKELVEHETATIARDRAAMEKLVEKQLQRFEKEMSNVLKFTEESQKNTPGVPQN